MTSRDRAWRGAFRPRRAGRSACLLLGALFCGGRMSVSTDAHSQPSGGTQPSATQPAASPPAAAPRSWAAATPAPARPRIGSKKLPPPTAEQLKGLELMQAELKAYEAGANDYRGTLTMIVRHHYEERRRRVLAALDAEIGIERKRLDEARDEAIRRLEVFVAIYSGDNAHPLATPDAMYRLAALYEERTRADYDAELSDGLKKPISLYREIIELYPNYEEISGVYYYLGHAYTDSGRFDEGQLKSNSRHRRCGHCSHRENHPASSCRIRFRRLLRWNNLFGLHLSC